MARQYEQYIDTSIHGSVVIVDHNLEAYPIVSFLRVTDPGLEEEKQTLISLFDPILTELEVLNHNQVKVTFSGLFTGYFRAFKGDVQDIGSRLDDIEEDVDFIYDQLDTRVLTNRWAQMNALRDSQIADLKALITEQAVKFETLKNRVDRL